MAEDCRICLHSLSDDTFISITNKLNDHLTILQGIVLISAVEMNENDEYPQFICNKCLIKLANFYDFRECIIKSDRHLREKANENKIIMNNDLSVDEKATIKNEYCDITQKSDEICEKKHICTDCEASFKRKTHLKVHILYKHSEKQFKCDICPKKFARTYDLDYHRRVHSGERPFICDICEKAFASSSYLHTHKKTHLTDKKLKCTQCQKTYINTELLKVHIRQSHTGERPYLCESCSQAFSSSSALTRHKKDVHDLKVQCPICKKFYAKRVLKDHVTRHKNREEGIKNFACEVCGKRFTCANSRKRHYVVHSGEKAFECNICTKSFNQKSSLQTHMRIHTQEMAFSCEKCDKPFRYKHHLKNHVLKCHGMCYIDNK